MAVRLRLTRVGGKKDPIWRVVVADQRSPRDGRVIETSGTTTRRPSPSTIELDEERVRDWLAKGAQPTDTGPQAAAASQGIDAPSAALRCSELLEYLARVLVDEPDAVAVEQFEEDDGTRRARARPSAEDDYGKVIGRGGRTANALRTVVKAAAVKEDRRVLVDIVD